MGCATLCFAASGGSLRLVDAVKQQDSAAVRAMIEKHAEVNAAQGDGATALHWAVQWNDRDTTGMLLRAGAHANAADDEGVTPLSLACLNANPGIVADLLKAGANPNATRVNGETPLMTAALTGNLEVVQLLLAAGAQANAKESSRGQTALMRAVAANHPAIVNALFAGGADVKARSTNRFTALLFAAQQGNAECARLLLNAGADVNDTAPDGVGGDTNARLMYKPNTEAGALLVAIDSGHAEMAEFLMDHGADVNQHGAGRTPLHAAIQQAMPGTVKALLAHGANVNARLEKRLPFLSRFILEDSGVEADPIGATPFWLASSFADTETMRILIDAGADASLVSKDGTTPLMVAAGIDFIDGQDKYGRRWFTDSMPLQKAALEAVKICLAAGNDIKAANENGQTALHGAAYFGSTLLVQFLADHGANVNAQNIWGQTPYLITQGLYLAGSFIIRKEAGDLLVKLGADKTLGMNDPYAHINGADLKIVADAKAEITAKRHTPR
jgi:ankyrin repeat protein